MLEQIDAKVQEDLQYEQLAKAGNAGV